ncbi:SRPBCC family protein [Congregibacter variabilis]|uniref:SRPBCC family protein n=1 Tax=Congregibacter variabilis TaxID=3081200 RepID=A0ABZ0HZR9_9GAMM|nr:SRPBCC family protein [Congregibacter sp. IMCC43200]
MAAVLFTVFWAGFAASSEWETQFDESGVRVDTRNVAGSDYKAFRAQARIPAEPEEVLARLQDVASYPDWFPDTLEARRLELDGDRWANYVRTDAPWPVKDRDAIYTQELQRSAKGIRIVVGVAPDTLPDSKDAVRVRAATGLWELVPDGDGTALLWEFHLEPGGNIPSGLANARVIETPRRALQMLKEYFAASARQ